MKPVILNVDDDDSGRYITTRILTREGFEVREARSGGEALKLAGENPDLVLLDVNLPDISGFEVCRKIKSDPRTASIPVLHLSATSVSTHDQTTGLETGADGYLTQPVEPGLLVATIKAILRARRAEREVRDAAQQWQSTFDAISHGVCLLDREGRVRRVNRGMAELFGTQPEKMVGRKYNEAFGDLAQEPCGGWPFERSAASGRRETCELRSGDRWLEVTADPMFDDAGVFCGAVRTVVDITGRKRQMEERERLTREVEAERARLEAVLAQMPVGVVIAEAPSGKVVLMNERISPMLGRAAVPVNDIREYGSYGAMHPDGRPYGAEEFPLARSILAGEVIVGEELEFAGPEATRITVRVSSAPIRNDQGYIAAAVATFHDITDRKELEEQLRQSQKMEAVGRLAGGVAHDFNNLLTIIGGYGQMILDGLPENDQIRKDMEAIMEAANRATALTRQLLTFSRRQMAQPRVLDLNRLVSRMNRILRRVIGEDVALKVELNSDLARIKADPGQIEQVIMNLVVNARDAMPKGGKLSIRTANYEAAAAAPKKRPKLRPGNYVELMVRDTGTGMDAETRSHLFEPFFTTKPKGKGTGLGLSTVYGIIKQNGGEIEVETEPGRGTTFRIYLPVMPDSSGAVDRAKASAGAPTGTETILLVEDETEVRRFARELLARQGYTVLDAASGPEAIRLWKRHRGKVDLLVTDIIMPQMSGRELADQLIAQQPGLKVLYMSGYTDDIIAQHGVLDSWTAFLQKPFTHETLGRKVREVLDTVPKGAG